MLIMCNWVLDEPKWVLYVHFNRLHGLAVFLDTHAGISLSAGLFYSQGLISPDGWSTAYNVTHDGQYFDVLHDFADLLESDETGALCCLT